MWKGALLVCGEPGTGKSRWVREEAGIAKARLFHWNARTDRSLREGREILHQQVRSREPLFVWIEGADDLTQEAQAFLRRILETASPNVVCCLEVRELWKMSPPVLSRCTVISMKSDHSFRIQRNIQKAMALGLLTQQPPLDESVTWRDIPALRKAAADPYAILDKLIGKSALSADAIEALRAIGAGSSPWIQLANYLMRQECE
jgi:replication-associated recombination protein RarA